MAMTPSGLQHSSHAHSSHEFGRSLSGRPRKQPSWGLDSLASLSDGEEDGGDGALLGDRRGRGGMGARVGGS